MPSPARWPSSAPSRWRGAPPLARDPIHVRIGLHVGEVIRDGDDFFGKNVVLAARIAARAERDEVLVSSGLRDLVSAEQAEFTFDDGRVIKLKGLPGSHRVYSAVWHSGAAGPSEAVRRTA
ncbi:MAG: adenylate/guanylate cyclase domain-containing protein [Solirubrobacteraceae bacterium]